MHIPRYNHYHYLLPTPVCWVGVWLMSTLCLCLFTKYPLAEIFCSVNLLQCPFLSVKFVFFVSGLSSCLFHQLSSLSASWQFVWHSFHMTRLRQQRFMFSVVDSVTTLFRIASELLYIGISFLPHLICYLVIIVIHKLKYGKSYWAEYQIEVF